MPAPVLLSLYCAIILLASLLGGWVPMRVRLTHRRMEVALSFVAGVMLGIALMHLLPHAAGEMEAWLENSGEHPHVLDVLRPTLLWLLAGFLGMFLLERFVCFHHHETPGLNLPGASGDSTSAHEPAHGHSLTWTGTIIGLTIHTIVAGVALAAMVASERHTAPAGVLAGFGMFLVIALHKPFDALTIITLMTAAGRPERSKVIVNALFALLIPVGVVLFHAGLGSEIMDHHRVLAIALAFSAGMFICIALSDLLPELQFHSHDRIKLSVALLLGLAVAWGAAALEEAGHEHQGGTGQTVSPDG